MVIQRLWLFCIWILLHYTEELFIFLLLIHNLYRVEKMYKHSVYEYNKVQHNANEQHHKFQYPNLL